MKQIKSIEEFERAVESGGLVVTDYFATWCAPCKAMEPALQEIERRFPQVLFLKVNVEEMEELAFRQAISAMPTFTFHMGGLRLNPSTIQGANKQKLATTIENLCRQIPPDPISKEEIHTIQPQKSTKIQTHEIQTRAFGVSNGPNGPNVPKAPNVPNVPNPGKRKFQRVMPSPHQQIQQIQAQQPEQILSPLVEIESLEQYEQLITTHQGLIVVAMKATWCLPCKMILPALHELARQFTSDGVLIVRVDVDQFAELAGAMEIKSVPTFILGKAGEQLDNFAGADANYLEQRIRALK